jgi:hypothetical protein
MKKHFIDNYFKSQLAGHEIKPAQEVWSRIDQGLPKATSNSSAKWGRIAAALILGFALAGIWRFSSDDAAMYTPRTEGNALTNHEIPQGKTNLVAKLAPAAKSTPMLPKVEKIQTELIASANQTAPHPILNAARFEADLKEATELTVFEQTTTASNTSSAIKLEVEIIPAPKDTSQEVAGKFKLLSYSANQVNNLLHGQSLESPFQDRNPIDEVDQVVGKIGRFIKNFKSTEE